MTVRELNGWVPATVTVDRNGEVVSVSVTESRFTREQTELLLQSRRLERIPRNSLGIPLSEATDPANDPSSWEATGRYVVPTPSVDFAAEAVRREKETRRQKYPDEKTELVWSVEHQKRET
ncbi:hypothetical protein [Microbacterium sp. MMO-10]|uniref:hypothetical protein n=1 Tax=Microbacterium sp. MMO-10 TaxID=3081272 RepID=UPI00301A328B